MDTATLIAQLRNKIVQLEYELDMSQKWGKAMAAKFKTVLDAVEYANKIKQEETKSPTYGVVPTTPLDLEGITK